jgi:hypothetical protein
MVYKIGWLVFGMVDMWAPSSAPTLLSVELNRRKQVVAFCLPCTVALVVGLWLIAKLLRRLYISYERSIDYLHTRVGEWRFCPLNERYL